MTSPVPYPAAVRLYRDEPLLSLLTRIAAIHGMRLEHLARHYGTVTADPTNWPAATANRHAATTLAARLGVTLDTLRSHIPDLIDPAADNTEDQPRLRRYQPTRPWFSTPTPRRCTGCCSQREGAHRIEWLDPWRQLCASHGLVMFDTSYGDIEPLDELVDAEIRLDQLCCEHDTAVIQPRALLAATVVARASRAQLEHTLLERMVRARPEWISRPIVPAPPTDLMLLPEIVAGIERLLDIPDTLMRATERAHSTPPRIVGTILGATERPRVTGNVGARSRRD